jgi:hypothetical protein
MFGRVLEANGETDEPTVLLPWRDKLIFKFFHSADGLKLLDLQTSEALYLVLAILSSIGENEGTKVTSLLAKCVLHEVGDSLQQFVVQQEQFCIPSNRWFHSGMPCMQDCTSNWEIRAGR